MTIITVTVAVVDSGRVDSQRKTNGVFIATQLNSTELKSNQPIRTFHSAASAVIQRDKINISRNEVTVPEIDIMSLLDKDITRLVQFRKFGQHRINVLLNHLKLFTSHQSSAVTVPLFPFPVQIQKEKENSDFKPGQMEPV